MTQHKAKHYSNILLVAPDNQPLNTISEHRLKYYLRKALASEISLPEFTGYTRVLQLKFEPKRRGTSAFNVQPQPDRCVVCSATKKLNLHHVVPRAIRTHFPPEEKNHQHGWCVLLCLKHHREADDKAIAIFETSLNEFIKKFMKTPSKEEAKIKRAKNALQNILARKRNVPEERIQELFTTANIPYMKEKLLSDYIEITSFENLNEGKIPFKVSETWAHGMIKSLGGVQATKEKFKEVFLELAPQFLAPGSLENKD